MNTEKIVKIILYLSVVILCPFLTYYSYSTAQAQNPGPAINGNCNNVNGNNNSLCNTYNYGPPKRSFSSAEMESLALAMSEVTASGKIKVQYGIVGCPDCEDLAKQNIYALSRAKGIRVNVESAYIFGTRIKGMALLAKDKKNMSNACKAITEAYAAARLKLTVFDDPTIESSTCALVIGQPVTS